VSLFGRDSRGAESFQTPGISEGAKGWGSLSGWESCEANWATNAESCWKEDEGACWPYELINTDSCRKGAREKVDGLFLETFSHFILVTDLSEEITIVTTVTSNTYYVTC